MLDATPTARAAPPDAATASGAVASRSMMPRAAAIGVAVVVLAAAWAMATVRFEAARHTRLAPGAYLERPKHSDFDRYIFGHLERQLLFDGLFHSYYFYDLMWAGATDGAAAGDGDAGRGDATSPDDATAPRITRVAARVLIPYPTHADLVVRSTPAGELRFRLARNRDTPSGWYRFDGPVGTLLAPLDVPEALDGLRPAYDADDLAHARRWNFWYPHRWNDPVLLDVSDARWFTIEVRLDGDRVEAFVDGRPVGGVTDATDASGAVGWSTGAQPAVYWDWVEVEHVAPDGRAATFRDDFDGVGPPPRVLVLVALLAASAPVVAIALTTLALWFFWWRDRPVVAAVLALVAWALPLPLVLWPRSPWYLRPIEPSELRAARWAISAVVPPMLFLALVALASMRRFAGTAPIPDAAEDAAAPRRAAPPVPRRCLAPLVRVLVALLVPVGAMLILRTGLDATRLPPPPRDAPPSVAPVPPPDVIAAPSSAALFEHLDASAILPLRLALEPGSLVDITFARHVDPYEAGLTKWAMLRVERPEDGAPRAALFTTEGYPPDLRDLPPPRGEEPMAIALVVRPGAARASFDGVELPGVSLAAGASSGPVDVVVHRGAARVALAPLQPAPPAQPTMLPEGVSLVAAARALRGRALLPATAWVVVLLLASGVMSRRGPPRRAFVTWMLLAALPAVVLAGAPIDPAVRAAWWIAAMTLLAAAAWYASAAAMRGAIAFQLTLALLTVGAAGAAELALLVHPIAHHAYKRDHPFALHRAEYQFRPMEADYVWPSFSYRYTAWPGWTPPPAAADAIPAAASDFPAEARPVRRIVCLGGSSTLGVGATAPHLAYPASLEGILRERRAPARPHPSAAPPADVLVINAGALGYSSFDNWLLSARDLPHLRPDLVILSFSANDGFPGWWLSRPQREVWESFRTAWEARAPLPRRLASSRLLAAILTQAQTLVLPWRRDQGALLVPPDDFRRNVGDIIERASALGARVLLVAEPYVESTQPGEAYYDRYHAILADLAARPGVSFLRPSLTAPQSRHDKVFADPVHPTDEGYRRIATDIADLIAREGLLERPATAEEAARAGDPPGALPPASPSATPSRAEATAPGAADHP